MRSVKINSILKYWRELSNASWINEVINEGNSKKRKANINGNKNSSTRSESEFDLVWNHADDNPVSCQLSYIKYGKDFKSIEHLSPQKDMKL